ncbi:hypothetical protein Poli38472_011325 [Pythium oligandrum]|uniref:Long-chain-fatty-acid--CoA ligase n=1 Tax=Pythium oligandrum TaxID=41045 RepID=A0A8K1CQK1_PYTOL|nr:hypothetical protein Poli38472_011325 [Pythium oligandrum]|eukprot:TMW67705.1 hypothetical protein Poli38472_011325 [Pythium oligandrum]
MGGTCSTAELAMSSIDFDSYKGIRYTEEVPNSREENRGPIYLAKPINVDETKLTLYENLLSGVSLENGNRRVYGTRRVVDGQPGEYEWITYKQALERSVTIAAGLTKFAGLKRNDLVGIFSKNRVEWCLSSHACDRMTYALVPLYDTLGADAVPYILNHTQLSTVIFAQEQFNVVLECKDSCPAVKFLVQYEDVTDEQRQLAEEKGVEIKSLQEIEALGKANPVPADPPAPEDIATICYTSGTTGNPKGVVLTHRTMAFLGVLTQERLRLHKDIVHISYLPLPHVFERAVITAMLNLGASAGFYCGNVLTLMDDIAELKPTIFVSVPRLFNRVYDKISQRVEAAGGIKKALFDQAYAGKKAALASGQKTHAFWDALVFSKIRQLLGGRVDTMLSGSAPLSADVKEFLTIVFGCDVVEGYGLSETAAGLTLASADMPLGPHVGAPLPNLEVRLEDVPEMGYTSNDKPRPRGEIICRGPIVFGGYFKEPDKTSEAIDEDGWFHTGDIGCWNADGTLSIIDRKKNIFKLSQGEYVAAEKLEGVFAKSKFISQIFVYGDSFQNALVGVAVPDPDIAEAWGVSKGRSKEDSTMDKLVHDAEFQTEVMADLVSIGKEAKLRGFEFVKKVHFHPDPFTVDTGLITPTFKLKRPQLKEYFQKQIATMYAELNK